MEEIRPFATKEISRAALCVCIVTLLLTMSCSYLRRSATSQKAPSPPVEVKDPIISMVMASSIDAKGQLVNPRFTFPQNEPQMTAVVRVGKIKGSQLNVTWYKTSESGDEKLFEHQIQVKSNDRAFSVGKNASGTLMAGTYKVVATLEGQTKEIEFDVSPPKTVQNKPSSSRSEKIFENQSLMQKVAWESDSQTAPATSASFTAVPGSSLVAGPSGTVPSPPKPQSGPTTSGCVVSIEGQQAEGPELDAGADVAEVISAGTCPEGNGIRVSASLTGDYRIVGEYFAGVSTYNSVIYNIDPCWLPAGTDLPGTKVAVKADALDVLAQSVFSANGVISLGDDTLAPRINVVSTPARGTKVKAGDKIKLSVTATEKRSDGPWQTGVKIIQITALPGGLVKDPWTNPSNLPKACNEKTWEQKDEATYTVPSNPPPLIKICAITQDYVGNESSQCGDFYTGEVWKGTIESANSFYHDPGTSLCTGSWLGQFTVVVGTDGSVSGEGSAKTQGQPTCQFKMLPDADTSFTFKLEGKKSEGQFELRPVDPVIVGNHDYAGFGSGFFGQPWGTQRIPVALTTAKTVYRNVTTKWSLSTGASGSASITIHMKCESCK